MLADVFFNCRIDIMLDWLAPGSVNEAFWGIIGVAPVAYEINMA